MAASANSTNQNPELEKACQVCSRVPFSSEPLGRKRYEIDLSAFKLPHQRNCPFAKSASDSKSAIWFWSGAIDDFKWCSSGELYRQGVSFIYQVAHDKRIICIKEQSFTSTLNFELPLRWLAWCQEHHSTCGPRYDGFKHPIYLIDCLTQRLVEDDGNRPFIALSYVWGPFVANKTTWAGLMRGDVLSSLPAVVLDAMTVVRKMGYEYLWVDRYCINQDSPSSQIEQMDRIYGRADFTIIAAAGTDANHGLPGVRNPPPTAINPRYHKVDNAVLVTPASQYWLGIVRNSKEPRDDIQESSWASRAWTFQEGLLSRRRLVFTEDHVYFECAEMSCWRLRELLRPDLEPCPGELELKYQDIRRPLWRIGEWEYRNRGRALRDIHDWIAEYSARTLSFDGDSLNGFLGVLNYAEKISWGCITHIWGLPVLASCARFFGAAPDVDARLSQGRSSIFHGLCWGHCPQLSENSSARSTTPPPATPRRLQFPSWLWIGWAGEASYNILGNDDQDEIRLLSTIHRVIPPSLGANSTAMLDIEAIFVPSDIVSVDDGVIDDDSRLVLDINGFRTFVVRSFPVPAYEECVQNMETKFWRICLLFGMTKSYHESYGLLLARSSGTDVERYNRIGLVFVMPGRDVAGTFFWTMLQDYGSRYERVLLE